MAKILTLVPSQKYLQIYYSQPIYERLCRFFSFFCYFFFFLLSIRDEKSNSGVNIFLCEGGCLVSGGHLRLPLCTLTCLSKYTTRIRVHRGRHFSPPDTRVNDRKPPSPIALCDPVRENGLGGFLSFICQIILLL